MEKFNNWFVWKLLRSGIGISFILFFGFIATMAYLGEKKKNNSGVHVMQEDVLYIRPVGFEEKQPSDTLIIE
jgi:hypothetical protein